MFERIYKSAADDADSAAEKMIGLFGDAALDPRLQSQFIYKLLERVSGDEPLKTSLEAEKQFVIHSKKFYDAVKSEGRMTQGLDDMILGIANNRETAIYLLSQATKTAENKFSNRKAILNKLAEPLQDQNVLINNIKTKLLNRLNAIVPSYAPGKYDINLAIDMHNKIIAASIKTSSLLSDDIQKKIENNFQQFAKNILPDNMKTFIVQVSFVMIK